MPSDWAIRKVLDLYSRQREIGNEPSVFNALIGEFLDEMIIRTLAILLLLSACQAPTARGPEMPAGSGPSYDEPGFTAWCSTHRGLGVCP